MTQEPIIRARGLTKQFTVKREPVTAVLDLDLDVAPGELVAFLGPNGAGKSTSLRMLTTLLRPTSGTATVVGHDIREDPAGVRRRIGYIGQGNSAGYNQRVRDELLSQGAFYGMSRSASLRRADELLASLNLAPLARRPVLGLSGGQKRRLDIALGLMHYPELLFLDEPSTGLDPQSRANLWQHLLDLRRERGTTLFFTTHYLEEADQFAERVLVMDRGSVIADDTASGLKTSLAGDVITLGFDGDAAAASAASTSARVAGARASVIAPSTVELVVPRGDRLLPTLLKELGASGSAAVTAKLRQPTLDDVFLALTGRSLREEGAPDSDGQVEGTTSTEDGRIDLGAGSRGSTNSQRSTGTSGGNGTPETVETRKGTVDA